MHHPEMIPNYIVDQEMNGQFKWETPDFLKNYPARGINDDVDPDDRRLRARFVCDFIAGMTDRYAIAIHSKLFVPQAWNLEVV
jgi:dGTP triphosphohydrolase